MIRPVHRIVFCFLVGLFTAVEAVAESPAPDSQMTLAMLAEVRQLRRDLQAATATIQRVQIVMFRLQVQGGLLENAKQRLEQARNICNQILGEREMMRAQIDQAEISRRNAQNPGEQRAAEGMVSRINAQIARLANRERECQVQQPEAETQFRNEDAKMADLQDQLERLDRVLGGNSRK